MPFFKSVNYTSWYIVFMLSVDYILVSGRGYLISTAYLHSCFYLAALLHVAIVQNLLSLS